MSTALEPIGRRRDVAVAEAIITGSAIAPANRAQHVLADCWITEVSPREARHLPFALADDARVPSIRVIADARDALFAALTAPPVPDVVLEAVFMRLLAESSHKADDATVDGLVHAVGLACDPLARQLGLWPTVDRPVPPCVFALAVRKLQATKTTFLPKPPEVRQAIIDVHQRLWEQLGELEDRYKRRLAVDQCIAIHGPQSDDETSQIRRRYALQSAGLLSPGDDDAAAAPEQTTLALAACATKPAKRTKKLKDG